MVEYTVGCRMLQNEGRGTTTGSGFQNGEPEDQPPPSFSSSPLHTPIWLPKVSAVIPALPRFTLIDPRTNTTQRSPEHSPYPFPPLSITSIAKPPRVREN